MHRRGDRPIFFECLLATSFRWLRLVENETYSGKHLFLRTSQLTERFIRDSLLEVNIGYRRPMLRSLRSYLLRLQIFGSRHLNRLIELLNDSIDSRALRSDSLQLLLIVMETVQPRVNVHRYDLMKILIRCSLKTIHEERDNTTNVHLMETCFRQLQASTTENFVPDSIRSLIATPQLNASYREYLTTLLHVLDA